MRRLLLVALMGMALSKVYFGSFVPPELRFKAQGFDMLKDGANAPKPRWFTNPAHLDPARMHPPQQNLCTYIQRLCVRRGSSRTAPDLFC
jgi:hypothetical protein